MSVPEETEFDVERLRNRLLAYFEAAYAGGCGQSIVFSDGILEASKDELLEYAQLAGIKVK